MDLTENCFFLLVILLHLLEKNRFSVPIQINDKSI